MDSPAGVGFSYSKNTTNYVTGDFQTAIDTRNFLLEWFNIYPEFVSNPFYIAGESYAGIYVPTLASQVAKGIKDGVNPVINFKGYMIGNAATDYKYDGNSLVPFAHGMALISDDIYEVGLNGMYVLFKLQTNISWVVDPFWVHLGDLDHLFFSVF